MTRLAHSTSSGERVKRAGQAMPAGTHGEKTGFVKGVTS
jgi:hypothetical protein